MASLVHVTDMINSRSIAINGETVSARAALADFYRCEPAEVEGKIEGKTLRIVNRGALTDLDVQLSANDTITVFEAAVAGGGVKGANAS